MQMFTQCIAPILLQLVIFLTHLVSLLIPSPLLQLHFSGGRNVIFAVAHIIIGEFVQLLMHVVITAIRKDSSGSLSFKLNL